jgi:hypothetical protein
VTRDSRTGNAALVVRVPARGRLELSGHGLVRVVQTSLRPGHLKLRVTPTRKTGMRLAASVRVKVRAKLRFHPSLGRTQTDAKTFNLLKDR